MWVYHCALNFFFEVHYEIGDLMLLSVIIPVYNVEMYINKCLDSLMRQITSDVEVICIDDGSTDNSGKICDEYAEHQGNIHVFHKSNGGVGSARNLGLKMAKGQYVAWIDPDDYVHPDWFRKLKEALDRDSPDLILFDYYTDDYGKIAETHSGLKGKLTQESLIFELSSDKRLKSGMCLKVISRKIFQNLSFDESAIIFEDYDVTTGIALAVNDIVAIPDCLYYYVRRKESLVNYVNMKKRLIAAHIAGERYRRFKEAGYTVTKAGFWKMALLVALNDLDQPQQAEERSHYRKLIRKDLINIIKDGNPELQVKLVALCGVVLSFDIMGKVWNVVRQRRYK